MGSVSGLFVSGVVGGPTLVLWGKRTGVQCFAQVVLRCHFEVLASTSVFVDQYIRLVIFVEPKQFAALGRRGGVC